MRYALVIAKLMGLHGFGRLLRGSNVVSHNDIDRDVRAVALYFSIEMGQGCICCNSVSIYQESGAVIELRGRVFVSITLLFRDFF